MGTMEHTILAVDDNNINIKLLSRTLTNNNFAVLTASSGKEAIEIVNSDKPDLILLDVLMPEMDGYQTCKILKENSETGHIPVIFLSAKNETIDKAKGFAIGACDYLTKPFDPIEIIARIRSHIAIRKDVIDLSHKYEDLKKKFNNGARDKKNSSQQSEEWQFLDKLKNLNYREANNSFRIHSRIKFSHPPVTTVFIPAYLDDQNFIYLVAGGFEKDYKTSMVQLLMEQFVRGLFKARQENTFHENELYQIFDLILDEFSPDIYKTAFTVSLGYINAAKSEFTSFCIHQSPAVTLNNKNEIVYLEPIPVVYPSRYAKIIKASRQKLPPKTSIVNYVSGRNMREDNLLEGLISTHSENSDHKKIPSIDNYFSQLPEKDDDQLIMSVTLL